MNSPPDQIGPFPNFRFDRKVGVYLSHSPRPADKECLREFFKDLRQGAVACAFDRTAGYLNIYTCNHVITFSSDGKIVLDIEPAIVQC